MASLNEPESATNNLPVIHSLWDFRRIISAVVIVAAALVLITAYFYFSFDRRTERSIVRAETLATMLLETSQAHLWFEEVLWGDTHEDISAVWNHLESADRLAQNLMEGADLASGELDGLKGSSYEGQMQEIIDLLVEFNALTHQRYNNGAASKSGTEIDQQYDNISNQLSRQTSKLETDLRRDTRNHLFAGKMMHLALGLLYVALAIILAFTLHRYEKNRQAAVTILQKRDNQLRQAQKMEAVGNMAGGIAHDFNNLLQAIIGYAEVLAEELKSNGHSTEDVEHILTAGHRASELTRQLLAYSRRQVIAPVELDLNQLITNLMNMLQRLIGENIALKTDLGSESVAIKADRGQMEQILMNLCLNARDAITDGGAISIETANVVIDETYCEDHIWARPGHYALLIVTDSGCGMDQNVMNQVFEPFFTTKDVGKGTGLGLSTVYGIVKQNEGMVNVYSEMGVGSTFKIYWPLIAGVAPVEPLPSIAPAPHGAGTILVAEDDAGVRNFVVRLLQDSGYSVLAALDGQEACNVFDEHRANIDLALLDVVMPHKSGREVMNHIRRSDSTIPVIFCSGYSMNAIHTDFVLDEGIVLLEKPYSRQELLVRLQEALPARK